MMQSLIKSTCDSLGLDPLYVAALVLHESEGDRWACRFEEKSKLLVTLFSRSRSEMAGYVPPSGMNPSLYDEKIWRAHSWGPMQVLGETARVLGFKGRYLTQLCDPAVGILYGCLYLRKCLLRASNGVPPDKKTQYKRAFLFYNGGGDLTYPDKLFALFEQADIFLKKAAPYD